MPYAIISTLLGAYFGFMLVFGRFLHFMLTAENLNRGSMLFLPPWEVAAVLLLLVNALFGAIVGLFCSPVVVLILNDKAQGSSIRRTILVHSVFLLLFPWITPWFVFRWIGGGWIIAGLFNASFVVTMALVSTKEGAIFIPFRRMRPRRPSRKTGKPSHHCKKCDYNLTGNESGVCPECGTRIPSAIANRPVE